MKLFKKNVYLKLTLDIIMMLLLVLLYQKNIISLMFHEVAGLCIFVLFIYHLVLNRKWIVGVTKKCFSKQKLGKNRVIYILNLLLGLSFLMAGISGILISKKIFPFHLTATWIPLHFFFSALCVILVGIHLGFHLKMIYSALSLKLPRKAGIAIAIIIVLIGGYCFTISSMNTWLTAPFSTQSGESHGQGMSNGEGNGNAQGNDNPQRSGNSGEQYHSSAFSFSSLLKLAITYIFIILAVSNITYFVIYLLSDKTKRKIINA